MQYVLAISSMEQHFKYMRANFIRKKYSNVCLKTEKIIISFLRSIYLQLE